MAAKKRKIKYLILILVAIFIVTSVCVVVYAYNVLVNYQYNIEAHSDMLEYSKAGNTITVKRYNDKLKATQADLIISSSNKNTTIDLKAADICAERTPTSYVLVFKNLPLNQTGYDTGFTVSDANAKVINAAVAKAEYADESEGIKSIEYYNSYAASLKDLELLNVQSNYNNIFELAGRYNSKIVVERIVYLIKDITIGKNFTINMPCSIDLLDTQLTLDANLSIAHSYAGSYFLKQQGISPQVLGTGSVTIKTPKAYYNIDGSISSVLSPGRLNLIFDYQAYGSLILDDALNFAAALIPKNIYSDLILQKQYQTFGVQIAYYLVEGGNQVPLSGRVLLKDVASDYSDLPGNLIRDTVNNNATIKITVSKDGGSLSRNIETNVAGTSQAAFNQTLMQEILTAFAGEGSFGSDINLLGAIKYVFQAGGFRGEIPLSFSESFDIPSEDENAIKLIANSKIMALKKITVGYDGATLTGTGEIRDSATGATALFTETLNSLLLRRGTVVLSDALTLKIGDEEQIKPLEASSQAEVMYYLKSSSSAFTTNKPFKLLNLQNDGLYLGDMKITSSWLGMYDLSYEIVEITTGEGALETEYVSAVVDKNNPALNIKYNVDYDGIIELLFDEPYTMQAIYEQIMGMKDNWYLMYTVVFDDNCCIDGCEKCTDAIFINIFRTVADEGSANQQFESSNPFDELFINEDTVWLEGGTFEVSTLEKDMYARIEIISIGGQVYASVANPMCVIVPDPLEYGSTVSGGAALIENVDYIKGSISGNPGYVFYKTIHFVTLLDYVPTSNTNVKVRCYYYNAAADGGQGAITLTQEYTIIIPGVFKCPENPADFATAGPVTANVFRDKDFYNMTIALFEARFGGTEQAYRSEIKKEFNFGTGKFVTLTNPYKVLHSDSQFARFELDYSVFVDIYKGSGIDTMGIHRLKNISSIIFDGVKILNMEAFGLMSGSALKELSAENCSVTDRVLYGESPYASKSYIYDIHLLKVNLNRNQITVTGNLFARTVKDLKLSGQSFSPEGLIDISGLVSIKDLEVLDVSNNGIYRFEVLKQFASLKKVYLYGNRLNDSRVISGFAGDTGNSFTVYGTDGYVNIATYVWLIKTSGAEIYAKTPPIAAGGFIKIQGTVISSFSTGGSITLLMQEGETALNAFASPTKLYAGGTEYESGKAQLERDLANLIIKITTGGSTGGVGSGDSYYTFTFYDRSKNATSKSLVLMQNYQVATTTIKGSLSPQLCSYIVAISVGDRILAMREFVVQIFYDHDN